MLLYFSYFLDVHFLVLSLGFSISIKVLNPFFNKRKSLYFYFFSERGTISLRQLWLFWRGGGGNDSF